MSLVDRVKQELGQLGGFADRTETLSVAEGAQSITVELTALDSLACSFTEFVLQTGALSQASVPQLQQISDTLSRKLGYLLEAIGALEIDSEQCVIQMRSMPPHRDDDGTSYYELLVRRGGELRLSRYGKTPGHERQIIPAHVTREVLLRLVADFAAAG